MTDMQLGLDGGEVPHEAVTEEYLRSEEERLAEERIREADRSPFDRDDLPAPKRPENEVGQ